MVLLGYDIGSSSIKACLLEAETGRVAAAAVSPDTELPILAARPGWAEQHPETWWEHLRKATSRLLAACRVPPEEIKAVGICYQMHGLVLVDDRQQVLRPAIIWCDSRAVEIGNRAFREIGEEACLAGFLNSPGNFTASRLRWVRENEPELFRRIHKIMLPGDYVAMRLTGEIRTTPSGLSEAILWDYGEQGLARTLLEYYGLPETMIPGVVPAFSFQGALTRSAAAELGLRAGTPVTYRSGDQPNNALSLNVLHPGEVATTAGTSGVVYGVAGEPVADRKSRVNTFVHVNHRPERPRYGVLLCVNGTGILMSWLKHNLTGAADAGTSYEEMNRQAAQAPPGAGGLQIFPYGNGAERTLENRNPGAWVRGLNFNIHRRAHLLRAAQEGIVFSLNYGLRIMGTMGLRAATVRAGNANLFLSPLFGEVFAAVSGTRVELFATDDAQGAARGAGIGAGVYRSSEEAFARLERVRVIEPDPGLTQAYRAFYGQWEDVLKREMEGRAATRPAGHSPGRAGTGPETGTGGVSA